MNRYGYIDHRIGNTKIILTTFMPWFSGFLPYHKEMVEINDDTQFKEVAKINIKEKKTNILFCF